MGTYLEEQMRKAEIFDAQVKRFGLPEIHTSLLNNFDKQMKRAEDHPGDS